MQANGRYRLDAVLAKWQGVNSCWVLVQSLTSDAAARRIVYPYAGQAGIEQLSSRGRQSYTNSLRVFECVGIVPSRRMTLNV